jgi:hypothetical protein
VVEPVYCTHRVPRTHSSVGLAYLKEVFGVGFILRRSSLRHALDRPYREYGSSLAGNTFFDRDR